MILSADESVHISGSVEHSQETSKGYIREE